MAGGMSGFCDLTALLAGVPLQIYGVDFVSILSYHVVEL